MKSLRPLLFLPLIVLCFSASIVRANCQYHQVQVINGETKEFKYNGDCDKLQPLLQTFLKENNISQQSLTFPSFGQSDFSPFSFLSRPGITPSVDQHNVSRLSAHNEMASLFRELEMFSSRMHELMNTFFHRSMEHTWQEPTRQVLVPNSVDEYYQPPSNFGNGNRTPVQLRRATYDRIY